MTQARSTDDRQRALSNLLPRLLTGGILAILVLSGLFLFTDLQELQTALQRFSWWTLIPALALTLWNYGLRFLKWQIYLDELDVRGLSRGHSLLVFLSAFAMSITPGKIGEFLKCAFLRRLTGTPVSQSSAILVAERLTDGLAMIVLASTGAILFSAGRFILAVAIVAAAAAIVVLYRPILLTSMLERLHDLPFLGPMSSHATTFFATSGQLVRPRLLLGATAIGVVAWLGECAAFFLILGGLGLTLSVELFLVATLVLAASSLAGALSMLPGGLGVAEASVAGMLLLLVNEAPMDSGLATAATLLIRFATLWFAVLLGGVALFWITRIADGSETKQSQASDQPASSRQLVSQRKS
jgi:uncharacterized membrane protein YbhN (UPF0104 family)